MSKSPKKRQTVKEANAQLRFTHRLVDVSCQMLRGILRPNPLTDEIGMLQECHVSHDPGGLRIVHAVRSLIHVSIRIDHTKIPSTASEPEIMNYLRAKTLPGLRKDLASTLRNMADTVEFPLRQRNQHNQGAEE